ncbi:MAG: MopE-related protein [Polyangia bacterium]|nr:MopE-related protein [Polyangia bacterium]
MKSTLKLVLIPAVALLLVPTLAEAQVVKPHILMIFDTSGSMLASSCDGQNPPVGNSSSGTNSNIYNVKAAMYQALFFAGADEANFGLMRFPHFDRACTLESCPFDTVVSAGGVNYLPYGGYYQISTTRGGADNNPGCTITNHTTQTTVGSWFTNGASEAVVVPVTSPAQGLNPPNSSAFDPSDGNLLEIFRWLDHTTTCSGGAITNPEVQAIPSQFTPLGRSLFYSRLYFQNWVIPKDDPAKLPCRNNIVILLTDGAESCDSSTTGFNSSTCAGGTEFNPYRQACLLNQAGIPVYVIVAAASTQANNIANYGGTGSAIVANFTNQNEVKAALLSIIAEAVPSGEVCNGLDDNCNGQIDEGVKNACTSYPQWCAVELCNGLDDNCDGQIDEGLPPNACGGPCGVPVPAEIPCNGIDDDCNPATPDQPAGCTCGVEYCNGQDDDCDGLVDDDDPDMPNNTVACGPNPALGICRQGTLVCNYGNPICNGAIYPQAETCNGLDDNCNGIVDDVIYNPAECIIPDCTSGCCDGHWACVSGVDTCVPSSIQAQEECNALDDDCDGRIDEGAMCETPLVCWYGTCAFRVPPDGCGTEHFARDGLCVENPCLGSHCPGGTICEPATGSCVDVCAAEDCAGVPDTRCDVTLATCDASGFCTASESACVTPDCYLDPALCQPGEVCKDGLCVPDPCFGTDALDCGQMACRDATCIATCVGVECDPGWACKDGLCAVVPCGTFSCPPGQVCVDGQCAQDPCGGVTCKPGQVCKDGVCVDDPCRLIVCPAGARCEGGQCVTQTADGGVVYPDSGPRPDAAPLPDGGGTGDGGLPEDFRITAGGGGCACQAGEGPGGAGGALGLLLVSLLWIRRRRQG